MDRYLRVFLSANCSYSVINELFDDQVNLNARNL